MKISTIMASGALTLVSIAALAGDDNANVFGAKLVSYRETPAVSSVATGRAVIRIDEVAQSISYEVSYEGLEGNVLQSHIHFGQAGVAGGIMLWFCGSATNPGPTGTQTCPQTGTVAGTLLPTNIVGPAGQGITAPEFAEVVKAIKAGIAYANVHSSKFPGGEIRGQLQRVHGKDDRDND